jgi:group I intron endonuclease
MAFIYKITNVINGKVYVGQTNERRVQRRWKRHISALKNDAHHNQHLQSSWNKYGEQSFKFEVIEPFDSELNFDIDNLERYWIKHFDSMNPDKGYNLESGGNLQKIVSSETKEKISKSLMGRVISQEHRKKVSVAKTGVPLPEETKLKISATKTGKSLSEEHKAKISLGLLGNKRSPHTEEAKNKMSLANKGKPWSEARRNAQLRKVG